MGHVRLVVSALFAAGCISDPNVICGDLACPAGSVCTPAGCASPDQLTACNGQAEGATCSTQRFALGSCVAGVCQPVVCGDSRIVGPEQCDDGNQRSGDGCSADCLSTEVCGNDYVDPLAGEQCDRGVRGLARDGCTSTCELEADSWFDVTPTLPGARYQHAMAYDGRRHRVMMFGGSTIVTTLGDTWEWDGVVWRHEQPAVSPSARRSTALAFDSTRGRIVMFGGLGLDFLGDTWEWDGITWEQRQPAMSPSPREAAAMAYDPVRGTTVLFGGDPYNDETGYAGDTWEWDGATWTRRTPATSPPPRAFATMAFDAQRNHIVLFGGGTFDGFTFGDLADTWEWDGTTWSQVTTPTAPPDRVYASMVAESGRLILYGGYSYGLVSDLHDSWQWSNGTWTALSPATDPGVLYDHEMAFDPQRGRIVLYGGGNGGLVDTLWEWNGSTWAMRTPASIAPLSQIAYQPLSGTSIAFNGTTTYEWDGLVWEPRAPANHPTQRTGAQLVARTTDVVLFGGSNGLTTYNDTWLWDGSNWFPQAPATSPPARARPALAYDSKRDRVVMFGGSLTSETWEWDGTTWLQRSPAHVPPPREAAALAYDAARGKVVLFGGVKSMSGPTQVHDDTWEWDGTDWTELAPAHLPSGRFGGAATFDPLRGRVLLFGGSAGPGFAFADTWEWDGIDWAELHVQQAPPATATPTIAYDAVRAETVLGTAWVHRFVSDSFPADQCLGVDTDADGLAGCADPDCWGRCAPLCPPGMSCDPAAPHCGDGTCSPIEDYRLCSLDCPAQ